MISGTQILASHTQAGVMSSKKNDNKVSLSCEEQLRLLIKARDKCQRRLRRLQSAKVARDEKQIIHLQKIILHKNFQISNLNAKISNPSFNRQSVSRKRMSSNGVSILKGE